MHVTRVLIVGWLAAAVAPVARCQEPEAARWLTLGAAVDRALERHPSVGSSRFAADAARASANRVSASRWPSLSASASATRFQEPMVVTPIHGFSPDLAPPFDRTLVQSAATVRYTLFDGSARSARIESAREEAEAAEHGVSSTAQQLVVRVSAAFLDVLGRAEVLAAHQRRIGALEAERARVRQLMEVGRAAQVDRLRVEAALASAEAERASVAAGLDVAEQQLGRLVGIGADSAGARNLIPPARAAGRDVETRPSLLAAALEANPGLARVRRQAVAADARVRAATGGRLPRVDLVTGYNSWSSINHQPTAEWNLGAMVSWPLFTGGAVTNEVRAARAAASAASEQVRLAEDDVADQLDGTLAAIREAAARVSSLETAVARSEEVARIERLRLQVGTGVQRDYLDAEAALFAVRAALVQARYGEIAALVRLAAVIGRLDAAWLAANLGGAQ